MGQHWSELVSTKESVPVLCYQCSYVTFAGASVCLSALSRSLFANDTCCTWRCFISNLGKTAGTNGRNPLPTVGFGL
uniref:Uncharacterized protein n=1 Tax=Knipowitschia caucasica TaxID=637954 RepID=A0AAV2JPR5_KNICA